MGWQRTPKLSNRGRQDAPFKRAVDVGVQQCHRSDLGRLASRAISRSERGYKITAYKSNHTKLHAQVANPVLRYSNSPPPASKNEGLADYSMLARQTQFFVLKGIYRIHLGWWYSAYEANRMRFKFGFGVGVGVDIRQRYTSSCPHHLHAGCRSAGSGRIETQISHTHMAKRWLMIIIGLAELLFTK